MSLKIALLGIVLLGSVLAVQNSQGYENPVVYVSHWSPPDFTLRWEWANASTMSDNYHDDSSCSAYPCFFYYEIRETVSGTHFTYYSYASSQNWYEMTGKKEQYYYYLYEVRAAFVKTAPGGSVNPPDVVEFTDWSPSSITLIDNSTPIINSLTTDNDEYYPADTVHINGLASDAKSGIARTEIYVNDEFKISSNTGDITYSQSFDPGDYIVRMTAVDNVSLSNSTTTSFTVIDTGDIRPPNVTISAVKSKFSNIEQVNLTVKTSDSGGVNYVDVFADGYKWCHQTFQGIDSTALYSFNCTINPYYSVANGTSINITYYAVAVDNAGNVNTTKNKNFTVVGNGYCAYGQTRTLDEECYYSADQAFFCYCDAYVCRLKANCTLCSNQCPIGLSCNKTGECFGANIPKCTDGTAYGQCSVNEPQSYCDNGTMKYNCTLCPCPSDQRCVSNSCKTVVCGNNICEPGESVDNCCRDCGCPEGKLCDWTTDECQQQEGPASYIEITRVLPQRTIFSPGQEARFILSVTDENDKPVGDAVVILNAYSRNYTSASLGNGLYDVRYNISLNANASFYVSFTAKRQNQTSEALPEIIEINRALEMELIMPQQGQDIYGDQTIQVKIFYPDLSPVMDGTFRMELGNRTIRLAAEGEIWEGFINMSREDYGAKDISFLGEDGNGNELNRLLVINYVERKDYGIYFVAILAIVGGTTFAYFVYGGMSSINRDYGMLKKEKDYLEIMDKRAHLEFFKRHIDENTFKKLSLEYQQKLKDVDMVLSEMRKRHIWLKWRG